MSLPSRRYALSIRLGAHWLLLSESNDVDSLIRRGNGQGCMWRVRDRVTGKLVAERMPQSA